MKLPIPDSFDEAADCSALPEIGPHVKHMLSAIMLLGMRRVSHEVLDGVAGCGRSDEVLTRACCRWPADGLQMASIGFRRNRIKIDRHRRRPNCCTRPLEH